MKKHLFVVDKKTPHAGGLVNHSLPCTRQHLSNDDCPEDKREDYQNCSVLYCECQLCTDTHTRAVLKVDCRYRFSFSLDVGLPFVYFYHFVPVMFAFVVLGSVSSAVSQDTG